MPALTAQTNGNVELKGQPAGHVNDIAGITAWDGDVVIGGDAENTFTIEGSLGLVKAMDREGNLHEPAEAGLTSGIDRDDDEEDIVLDNDLMAKTMWGFEATDDIIVRATWKRIPSPCCKPEMTSTSIVTSP